MATQARREAPHHRSLYCVKAFGCQRAECRARNAAYTRARYRKVGYGTWQPLVDGGAARQHVAELQQQGVSIPAVAKAARVSTATLARLLYGVNGQRSRAKMRWESAQAILALRPEDCAIADGARIDATGTRRRIQALVAMGWSFTALAPQIGIHDRPLGQMARARHVSAGSARKVKAAYKRLAMVDPEHAGVHSQARTLARRVAQREGWVTPAAWDENIDDPNAQPEQAKPYQPAVKYRRDPMRKAEIEHLYLLGESLSAIARQLGGNEKYISDQLAEVIRERAEKAQRKQAA